MDTNRSHRFRLDDFDPSPRVAPWEALPPIAAHIRWLKRRISDLLPAKLTVLKQMVYQRYWDDLVDSEAATWRYGNSPHGWYARQPEGHNLLVDPDTRAFSDSHLDEDEECSDEWDVIGVPTDTGTQVLTASTWLEHVEDSIRKESGSVQAYGWGDRSLDKGDLAGFLAVIAAHCVQDAESLLIRGRPEALAWHSVTEATELANRAERFRKLVASPMVVPTIEALKDRFYVADDGYVVVEFQGEVFKTQRRENARAGFQCIKALLKEPLHSLPSETLAVEFAGYKPVYDSGEARVPLIEPDEYSRLVRNLKRIRAQKNGLDRDADDYEVRHDELDEEEKSIARYLTNKTYQGRPKLELGRKQLQNRKLGATIVRAIEAMEKKAPKIGAHFRESLHGLHGEKPSYSPQEDVKWRFDAPETM
ncbi:MAG: hypothetical protein GC168_10000 [Candidatus Hydrogenedens sp.]|nr:hypothetical protein [Candidatus Hydrogenedens sp.]